MVLPAPASMRMTLPPRRMRKLLTGMKTEPSALPTNCAACARSMPMTRSTEVLRTPSLNPCTSTSPTRMLGAAISETFSAERDHTAGRNDHCGGEKREWDNERAARDIQKVADHDRRKRAKHLGDAGAHTLRLCHIESADHAVHEHLGARDSDLLRAQRTNHQHHAPSCARRQRRGEQKDRGGRPTQSSERGAAKDAIRHVANDQDRGDGKAIDHERQIARRAEREMTFIA